MARDALKRLGIPKLAGRSVARLVNLVKKTSSFVTEPADLTERLYGDHPGILAFWHGQFMLVSLLNPHGAEVRAMVARHGDAEVIGQAMSAIGVELIRGAGAGGRRKDRGGAHALRAAVKALQEGATVAMTADVPPGPARRAGEGIITLARLSGRPIMPVAVATSRFVALDTWSRMTINMPFSRLAAVGAEHIRVPRDATAAELESLRLKLETSLNAATERAYALAGADYKEATPITALPADAAISRLGFRLGAYRVATRLIEPIAPIWLAIRQRQGKEDARRRQERYGIAGAARPTGRLAWVHAASVGEANAAFPLIRALSERDPNLAFVLTTGTLTSADLSARRLGPKGIHQFVPLDSPRFARRFLDHWQPDIAIFAESEIWPNLVLEISRRRIPLAIINARMSQRSFNLWRRNIKMARPLFSRFNLVLAQNETIGGWFARLGARDVRVTGNLKIDSPPPPVDQTELQRLKAAIGERPIFLAASTHPGEDEIVTAAHVALTKRHPGILTIIVPRHPERGPSIVDLVTSQGLKVRRRASGELPDASTDIYVADTIGELGTFYALSSVALIGGSLVPHGGQNPIEAIRHGCAVIVGPHTQNFTDSIIALSEHAGVATASDAETLTSAVANLLDDPAALATMNEGASAALEGLAGALERTTDAIIGLLPTKGELLRAS